MFFSSIFTNGKITNFNIIIKFTKSFYEILNIFFDEKAGLLPPFSLKSSGIGLTWLLDNIDKVLLDIKQNKCVTMYKSKVGYPRYYRKKLIEYNKVDEDFFKNRYYKDLDNMQMSIISELKEAHINLQPDKHYFNITLSQLFNIEKKKKVGVIQPFHIAQQIHL